MPVELPPCRPNFRHADYGHATCYGDSMQELSLQAFVTFVKVVAVICIIALVLAVWPGGDEE